MDAYKKCMPKASLFSLAERRRAEPLVQIVFTNPFSEERQELNRLALGGTYDALQAKGAAGGGGSPVLAEMVESCRRLADNARERIRRRKVALDSPDVALYESLVYFLAYHDIASSLDSYIERCIENPEANPQWRQYAELKRYCDHYLRPSGLSLPTMLSLPELAAFVFQIRRAFYCAFRALIGDSPSLSALRKRVWNSVFTHDMRRYARSLSGRMNDISTLIVGPSGSGKEVVAQCIALSRHVPFDPSASRFAQNFVGVYFPINLSALSATLIESELFGHRKGAFTGALQDRAGYFESSGPFGSVFLDEIGDTDVTVQIKLLRVLQTRQFQRLGDTRSMRFEGKAIAATNADLGLAIERGRFREDLYYRLCSDRIETPALRAVLDERPEELERLVRFVAERVAGEKEADALGEAALKWIRGSMPERYEWPGNVRELEQCVRNVLVHGEYWPHSIYGKSAAGDGEGFGAMAAAGRYTLNGLIGAYVKQEYERTPSLAEVGKRLRADPRTVRKHLG